MEMGPHYPHLMDIVDTYFGAITRNKHQVRLVHGRYYSFTILQHNST